MYGYPKYGKCGGYGAPKRHGKKFKKVAVVVSFVFKKKPHHKRKPHFYC